MQGGCRVGVLSAQLFVEPLRLVRALEQAAEAAAVAMKDGAYPHKGGCGFTVLLGIHEAKGRNENAFVTFRVG